MLSLRSWLWQEQQDMVYCTAGCRSLRNSGCARLRSGLNMPETMSLLVPRILWKKNEVADYEATTFSIFYNNTLFLVLVIIASFFVLKNFNPTVYPLLPRLHQPEPCAYLLSVAAVFLTWGVRLPCWYVQFIVVHLSLETLERKNMKTKKKISQSCKSLTSGTRCLRLSLGRYAAALTAWPFWL